MESKTKILYLGVGFLLYHTAISFGYLFEVFIGTSLTVLEIEPLGIVISKEAFNLITTLFLVYFGIKYFQNKLVSTNTLFVLTGFYFIAQILQFCFTYYGIDFLEKNEFMNFESLQTQYEYYGKYYLHLIGYLKVILSVMIFYYFSK